MPLPPLFSPHITPHRNSDQIHAENERQKHQDCSILNRPCLVDVRPRRRQHVDVIWQGHDLVEDGLGSLAVKKAAAVNMMGAVSPAARPIPRMEPVRIPGKALGRTTLRVVCHFDTPRAREASRKVCGTALNASSEAPMIVGRTRKPSVKATRKDAGAET